MQIAIATANQRDGPCTSAASFEARFPLARTSGRRVCVRHIFIDSRPRLCYGENARSSEGRHR